MSHVPYDPHAALMQLQAQMQSQYPGVRPGVPMPAYVPPGVPTVAPLTRDDVQAMINASMQQAAPVPPIIGQFEALFKRALSQEDFALFVGYSQRGAPGFNELVQSDKLIPVAQLFWDELKGVINGHNS